MPGSRAAATTLAVVVSLVSGVTTVSRVTWDLSSKLMVPKAQLQGSSGSDLGSDPGQVAGEHYHPLPLLAAGKSPHLAFYFDHD